MESLEKIFEQTVIKIKKTLLTEIYPVENGIQVTPYKSWLSEEFEGIIETFVYDTFSIAKNVSVSKRHVLTRATLAPFYHGERVVYKGKKAQLKHISSTSKYFISPSLSWSNEFENLTSLYENLWGKFQKTNEEFFEKKTNALKANYSYFSVHYIKLKLLLSLRSAINEIRSKHSKDASLCSDQALLLETITSIKKFFLSTTWIITSDPSVSLKLPLVPLNILETSYSPGEKNTASFLPNEPYGIIENLTEPNTGFGILSSFYIFSQGLEDKFHMVEENGISGMESIFFGSAGNSGEIRALHLDKDYQYHTLHWEFSYAFPKKSYVHSGSFNIQKWIDLRNRYREVLLSIYGIWLEPE